MNIREAVSGRWQSILLAMGIEESYLTGKHGPCPLCGEGKDRWRFTDHKGEGRWICNHCGKGDGFELLMRLHHWSFLEAKKAVGELIPGSKVTPKHDDKEKARRRLNELRNMAVSASEVPEVVSYLAGRGLDVPPGLEAVPSMPYYDDDLVGNFPVMLGRVVTKTGKPVTYHRTYIHDGKKATVKSPRKMMPTARESKGWAIRLYPANDELVIAEGIETAIACQMLWGIPAWSTVCANGMLEFELPDGIRKLIIAGDNDLSFTGQAAAYEKARRMVGGGLEVVVRIPNATGDWNDVLRSA